MSKGGIGFTRNGAQGQGYGALYNQGTGAATSFTTADEILRWTSTGVVITGTTTISGITSIGKTTAPAAGILGIKAGTNQNIEVRGGITDATAIAINAVNDAGAAGVPLELLGSRITVAAALRYGGVDLANSVTGTGSMVLSASPTFTGTASFATGTFTGAVNVSASASAPANMGIFNYGGISLGFRAGSSGYTFFNNAVGASILDISNTGVITAYGAVTAPTLNVTTMASTAQTNVVCYNTGTGLTTYQTWATGCLASSARFKENVTVKSNADALKVVTSLEPVTFNYKKSADMGSDKHNGFIAEQVVKVAPDLVVFEKDGKTPRAVKYQEMAPYFAGAIRELKAANDNLKAEIEQLKKRVK